MPVIDYSLFNAINKQKKKKNKIKEEAHVITDKIYDKIVVSPFVNTRIKITKEEYDSTIKKHIIHEYYINRSFSCIEDYFTYLSINFSISAFRVFHIISMLLDKDCNYVYVPIEVVETFYKTNKREVLKGINELISKNIIIRTNRKSFYVINHHIIFKGNVNDFEINYNKTFSDDDEIIKDNKLILPEFNVQEEQERIEKVLNKYSNLNYNIEKENDIEYNVNKIG